MTLNSIPEGGKHLLDAASVLTVVGTLAQVLPPLAALFTIVWLSMQMFAFIEARIKAAKEQRGD